MYNGGGTVTISESIISGNRAGFGGGIASNGVLEYGGDGITLNNSIVCGNMAVTGGGVGNGGDGGGGYTGLVVVNNSTISGNTATTGSGGGIANTYAGFLNKVRMAHLGPASINRASSAICPESRFIGATPTNVQI